MNYLLLLVFFSFMSACQKKDLGTLHDKASYSDDYVLIEFASKLEESELAQERSAPPQ